MYTFIIGILILFVSYFVYGTLVERIFGIDETLETPAIKNADSSEYLAMDKIKLLFLRYINIAGLGPIFGAIQGALFGPVAFLWIILGTVFAGAVHDFCSGFLSVRQDGASLPMIIEKYLGTKVRHILAILIVIVTVLVVAAFSKGAATLLSSLTGLSILVWLIIIFLYFVIASIVPVNKIFNNIYPIFGVIFILVTVLILGGILCSPNYSIPEITTSGLINTKYSVFPYLFVTITCGAISGYHATQSSLVSRNVKSEKDMKLVFYGAMLLEGFTALIWAAIAMAIFKGQPQLAVLLGHNPALAVKGISYGFLGNFGLILAIICVAICPIITGDTILRSGRFVILEELNLTPSNTQFSKFKIIGPLIIIAFICTLIDFTVLWKFFSWAQITISSLVLWTGTVYLMRHKRHYIITILPAIFCTCVSFSYLLQVKGSLNLDPMLSNILALIITIIITIFVVYYVKVKDPQEELI